MPEYKPLKLPEIPSAKQSELSHRLYAKFGLERSQAISGLHLIENPKLNSRLIRNAGGSVTLHPHAPIQHATHLISIAEMDRKLAHLPQKERLIGSR